MLKIWLRIGEAGEYESFDDLESACDLLVELDVGPVQHWESSFGVGVSTSKFSGRNFISFYWGDEDAKFLYILSSANRAYVESRLGTMI
jgi:hypothetical protein